MRRFAILALLIAGAWAAYRDWRLRPVTQAPGVLAAAEPRQAAIDGATPFPFRGYALQPLARYDVTARLLSRQAYRAHRESDVSPLDFALGWGPMSDTSVLDHLEVEQSSRYFTVHFKDGSLSWDALAPYAANTHLIPADAQVRDTLDRMRPGQVIELDGVLVEAAAADGWRWRSSLTRNDTGAGACELMWVERARVIR